MKRTVILAISLLMVSALIASAPLLRGLWARIDAPFAHWRQQIIDEHQGSESDALKKAHEEIAVLKLRLASTQRQLSEYIEIEKEAGVDPASLILTEARIISRSTGLAHVVSIDRGAVDRVRKHMAVTIGWSLVGVVAGEQAGQSLVRLVTDSDSRIPAKIIDDGAELEFGRGVCAGTGDLQRMDMRLVQDRPGLSITPGLHVVTAGGPGSVPPGLILGVITKARRQQAGDHWHIELEPWAQVSGRVHVLRER